MYRSEKNVRIEIKIMQYNITCGFYLSVSLLTDYPFKGAENNHEFRVLQKRSCTRKIYLISVSNRTQRHLTTVKSWKWVVRD